jgi:hypothetical protein
MTFLGSNLLQTWSIYMYSLVVIILHTQVVDARKKNSKHQRMNNDVEVL